MTSEVKVGVFTTVGLAILGYMIIVTGSCGDFFRKKEGFKATALFTSIAGLEKKAAVRIAGVRVGEVMDIVLTPDGIAEVSLLVADKVKLHQDASAAVSSLGLMGEKYVEIFPGSADQPLIGDGAVIKGKEPLSIDQMGAQILSISGDIKQLTSSLSSVLGSEEGQRKLRSMVSNLAAFSEELKSVVAENRVAITQLLQNGTALSKELRTDIQTIATKTDRLLETMQITIEENRSGVRASTTNIAELTEKLQRTADSLNSILKKIDEGNGTIGKLVNETTTHDKVNLALEELDKSLKKVSDAVGKVGMPKMSLGMRSEYLTDSERAKSYLSLGLNTKGKRYFLLEFVHDPTRVRWETVTATGPDGQTTTRRETVAEDLTVTAQGGVRFGAMGVRGGFYESGAGLGIDYVHASDRLKLSLDGYDFGRNDQPHIKVGARVGVYKDFYLTVGGDDLLLDDRKQFYVGFGFGAK